MGDDKRFLTVEEFTERLNALGLPFSVRTIRVWVAKGKIKAIRPGARAWYIPIEEVERICRSGGERLALRFAAA
jgi:excisionase family DNA binding protein